MRIALYILLFLLSSQAFSQAAGKYSVNRRNAKAIARQAQDFVYTNENAYAKTQLTQQVEAWEKLTEIEPANANHWLNYYVSTRLLYQQLQGNTFSNKAKEELRQIAEKMDKQVAQPLEGNFEKQLIRYYETKAYNYIQAQQYLLKAYKLNPKNGLLFPELALYYELEGDIEQHDNFINKIKAIDNSSTLYKFCLVLLSKVEDKSIIFTNGEYDTYAMQRAKKALNKNVAIISISFLKHNKYRKRIVKDNSLKSTFFVANGNTLFVSSLLKLNSERSFYLSATVDKDYLKPIAKNLQSIGFAYKHNSKDIITKEVLWQNIMQLNPKELMGQGGNDVLKNLMPAFITLYRSYKNMDEKKAKKVYYKAKAFAQTTGFWSARYEVYFK